MSTFSLTDDQGNIYLLSGGGWFQPPGLRLREYQEALDALKRIDAFQLFRAESEIFHFHNFELHQRLERRLGPNWRTMDARDPRLYPGIALHAITGHLSSRWALILDAIYHGDLSFTKMFSSPATEAAPEEDSRGILRVKIHQALAAIVAQERAEARHHEKLLGEEIRTTRAFIYTGAFLTGLWNAGADLAQWLKEVNDVVNPLHRSLRGIHSSYRALQRNSETGEDLLTAYRDEVLTAEKRELVQVLGFDPSSISRAQFHQATELAKLIWEDPALQAGLRRFVKDYVKAQHPIEITEFSGAAAFAVLFTILLAAVTAGAGLAAGAASQARHLAKFRKVGQLLMEFAEQVKKARKLGSRGAKGNQKANFEDFESLGEVDVSRPTEVGARKDKPKRRGKTDFSKRKGVPPASLDDAVSRLNSMGNEITRNGYQPKYTDAELKALAETGDVSKDRYQVRFMESRYLTYDGGPGLFGAPMRGTSGSGAKYWSTSFDQLEDADTDARLIAEKLGLDYDPNKEYALIVIDTEKAAPLTGVKSVPATFDKVSEFANRELPKAFPKEFTDSAMTPEFQEQYARHYQAALDGGFLKDKWSTDMRKFEEYLKTTDLSEADMNLLKRRMQMQDTVGNNQYYEGNGLTRDNIAGSGNQYGAVETLNFERQPVNLQQLEEAGAISYVSRGF